jgi:hypothetical protein
LPPLRPVQAETIRVCELALDRGLDLVLLTRGRVPRRLVKLLAAHPDQVRVGIGLFSLDKPLVRRLEPLAASPRGRLRDLVRLATAGVPVEVRLEPLIPGLTDTRENLAPVFRRLADAGITRVVAHYLFLHPGMQADFDAAIAGLPSVPPTAELFEGGALASIGSLGTVKNLPREVRRDGLARIMAMGAEYGLEVSTGATQNPDLPRTPGGRGRTTRPGPSAPTPPPASPGRGTVPPPTRPIGSVA